MGANKRPFYRVVVADQRSPRNGRFIENIGRYHPLEDPSLIEIDEERALHWLRVGAQPSDQVRNLMDKIGIWGKFTAERPNALLGMKPARETKPAKEKVSKKAATKAASAATQPEARSVPAPVEAEPSEPEETAAPAPEAAEAAQQEPEAAEPEAAEPEAAEPEAAEPEAAEPEAADTEE
jgi:small subunit ribosomal protein S16